MTVSVLWVDPSFCSTFVSQLLTQQHYKTTVEQFQKAQVCQWHVGRFLTVPPLDVQLDLDQHPQSIHLLPLQLIQLCPEVVVDEVQLFGQSALLRDKKSTPNSSAASIINWRKDRGCLVGVRPEGGPNPKSLSSSSESSTGSNLKFSQVTNQVLSQHKQVLSQHKQDPSQVMRPEASHKSSLESRQLYLELTQTMWSYKSLV